RIAVTLRPVIAEINHHAAMGVSATGLGGGGTDTDLANFIPGLTRVPMEVVGRFVDEFIEVLARMFTVLAFLVSTGHDRAEMAYDRVNEKQLAIVVPVVTPGIGSPFRDHFKSVGHRVKAPNAGIQGGSLVRV